jgi:macrolide-specific efflux system membrane fusion protein
MKKIVNLSVINVSAIKNILRNKKVVWGTVIAVILVLMFSGVLTRSKSTSIINSEVAVGRSDMTITVLSTGTVAPQNRLAITPTVPGRIETILVAEGQDVKKGQVLAWMSSTERAALIDAARSDGAEELAKWQELYKATPIIAPISGTIIVKGVEEGQSVINSSEVFVMSDRLTVKAQVDETDIAQIKLGERAEIILDAYPENAIESFTDKIAFDATTVNSVTTYIVDIVPHKVPAFMRSGMTANITSYITEKKNILVVPNDAIKTDGDAYYVVIKRDKSKKMSTENQVRRNIEIGVSDGKNTEILSGVEEGDILIVGAVDLTAKSDKPKAAFGGRRR